MLIPVILSGGSGTRLWPLSRELYPKQLHPLVGKKSMLQQTVTRLFGLQDLGKPIVVCNETHRFMVAEQLQELDLEAMAILLEPVGRNTAPAVAVAAFSVLGRATDNGPPRRDGGTDPVLLVLPADHFIRDREAFHAAIGTGLEQARQGKLVTFGVVPHSPETGYGYIHRVNGGGDVYVVDKFVEKPDHDTAQSYVSSGEYYWNSGMFMFRASRYLDELKKFCPEMVEACLKAVVDAEVDLDFTRLQRKAFESSPSDSIDYAVMEKTDQAVVVPLDAGWSDVGSWSSLLEASESDEDGNALVGDVTAIDSRGCYVYSGSRLVATLGLQDHVVVETKDAVLVAPKDRVQDVKRVVEQLKAEGRYETSAHREVFRPWGSYDSVDQGERFQVKRLTVLPGAVLSLQMHHHRAEHWVVVSGTAKITRGEEEFLLQENESTFIPLGTKHRIANPGKVLLHIIEVQSGSYLGEDDIVRFDDNYGRAGRTD